MSVAASLFAQLMWSLEMEMQVMCDKAGFAVKFKRFADPRVACFSRCVLCECFGSYSNKSLFRCVANTGVNLQALLPGEDGDRHIHEAWLHLGEGLV